MESNNSNISRAAWTNGDRIKLIKLRIQGHAFDEIGRRLNRSSHSARSEYGRIRRGETDVQISLKDFPELRNILPIRKA